MLDKLYLCLAKFFVTMHIKSSNTNIIKVVFRTRECQEMEKLDKALEDLEKGIAEATDWEDVNILPRE